MSLVYMLDTNISSAAIRGEPAINRRLDALPLGSWCLSAITVAEHVYGVARRPQAHTLGRLVRAFLSVAEVVSWGEEAAELQGVLRARLEAQGTPIHEYDLMIAAHALSMQLILVTDNEKHFRRVPGLSLENWLRTS